VVSSRDSWVFASSKLELEAHIGSSIDYFNHVTNSSATKEWSPPEPTPTAISWSRGLTNRARRGERIEFHRKSIVESIYRPFQRQYLYSDAALIEGMGALSKVYPDSQTENFGFVLTSPSSHFSFAALMLDRVPDLHTLDTGQFFARYSFEVSGDAPTLFGGSEHARIDNVTDEILTDYRITFGPNISKDDIFFYVYGVLHSPQYRVTYAADLKKMLPRIPKLKAFEQFRKAGHQLAHIHIGYENAEPFPLEEIRGGPDLTVKKMRFAGTRPNLDRSRIVYNDDITLAGVPLEAHDYMLGSRSAIEWILERYQVKTDKASGIVNDPNDWGLEHGNPRYILDLLKSIVTVSVETVAIVKGLPPLDIIE